MQEFSRFSRILAAGFTGIKHFSTRKYKTFQKIKNVKNAFLNNKKRKKPFLQLWFITSAATKSEGFSKGHRVRSAGNVTVITRNLPRNLW